LQDITSISLLDYTQDSSAYPYGDEAMLAQAVYDYSGAYSVKMGASHDSDFVREQISDAQRIAEIIAASYPSQAPEYNCFIDIDRRLEVEVSYKGPGGQRYVQTRVFPY
jgi:hypothetical protein